MKFKCDPNGKLLPGAPGNYKCGQTYLQPFSQSKFKYWELLEEPPVLKVPKATPEDSVYNDVVYVPDEQPETIEEKVETEPIRNDAPIGDAAVVELSPSPQRVDMVAGVVVDPNAPATIESHMKLNLKTGNLTEAVDEPTPTPSSTPIETAVQVSPQPKTREELKAILDARGVKYVTRARTETLAKMVEDLEKPFE